MDDIIDMSSRILIPNVFFFFFSCKHMFTLIPKAITWKSRLAFSKKNVYEKSHYNMHTRHDS